MYDLSKLFDIIRTVHHTVFLLYLQRLCLDNYGALFVNDTIVQESTSRNNIIKDISFDSMSNTIYWITSYVYNFMCTIKIVTELATQKV